MQKSALRWIWFGYVTSVTGQLKLSSVAQVKDHTRSPCMVRPHTVRPAHLDFVVFKREAAERHLVAGVDICFVWIVASFCI